MKINIDVFSTMRDKEYPRDGATVVFQMGSRQFVGTYNSTFGWVSMKLTVPEKGDVLWFYLPNLRHGRRKRNI